MVIEILFHYDNVEVKAFKIIKKITGDIIPPPSYNILANRSSEMYSKKCSKMVDERKTIMLIVLVKVKSIQLG